MIRHFFFHSSLLSLRLAESVLVLTYVVILSAVPLLVNPVAVPAFFLPPQLATTLRAIDLSPITGAADPKWVRTRGVIADPLEKDLFRKGGRGVSERDWTTATDSWEGNSTVKWEVPHRGPPKTRTPIGGDGRGSPFLLSMSIPKRQAVPRAGAR